jgi:hypothetical protein
MNFPPLVVSTTSAILLVDLDHDTYRVLLPFPGCMQADRDRLVVVRGINEQTRIDQHDRNGLVWSRRLRRCFDPHSVVLLDEGDIAVCSTGTNEVIFLNADGVETRRWSPEPKAEADSWHLNALGVADGRVYVTCFGKFSRFRGWEGKVADAGLVLEVESGRGVAAGLSAPHDPCRLDGGWLVNDSDRSQLVFIPDGGTPQVVAKAAGFSRGLAVLPEHFVVGFSSPRDRNRSGGTAAIVVVEKASRRIVKSINVPYPEIGTICLAPKPDVIEAIDREQSKVFEYFGLFPTHEKIGIEDRLGSIEIAEAPVRSRESRGWEVWVRVTNESRKTWSSCNEPPLQLAYQVVGRAGELLLEGQRTPLPVPLYPDAHLTCRMYVGMPSLDLPSSSRLRITLVQETVAWWEESVFWRPAYLPLPPRARS